MWLIEEKVNKRKSDVWFNPWIAPTIKETEIINTSNKLGLLKFIIIIKGFIFWTVIKIKKFTQFKDFATLGIQAWKGAAPNLIDKDTISKEENKLFSIKFWVKQAIKKITEAMACVRKYLIAASLVTEVLLHSIRGIKVRVLSSSASHLIRSEGELKIIKILIKIELKKSKTEGENHTGEKVGPIDGAWARKLNLAYLSVHVDVNA